MNSNEPLKVATLTALLGTGATLNQTDVQLGLTSDIAERGTTTPCFLTAVYVQNYTAERIFVK